MLHENYPVDKLRDLITPIDQWHPYPTINDRDKWQSLPESVRQSAIQRGEKQLNRQWEQLPVTLFLEYVRTGNRQRYQEPYYERRAALVGLVIAECVESEGRFIDDIINGIWYICEESFWGLPAHIVNDASGLPDTADPYVDLFAAETSDTMAWVVYLLDPKLDEVSPLITPRIQREITTRILEPCARHDDFWWMGFLPDRTINNWNPWICSNWLSSVLIIEPDQSKRAAYIAKILRCLDKFLAAYHPDGGCNEGPSYWTHAAGALFQCLELLRLASDSQIDFFNEPLIGNMGRFICNAHIHDNDVINFADASALISASHGPITTRFGNRLNDTDMMSLGAYFINQQPIVDAIHSRSLGRYLGTLSDIDLITKTQPDQPYFRDVWLPGIQVMTARDKPDSPAGLFLAAKGGHNNESHNHNDVGQFIVYTDGNPAIIDAGVETYTRNTFNNRRYEIWTMQSAYHNLPTIAGIQQQPSRDAAAHNVSYHADDTSAQLSLDIAPAYPPQANLKSWLRTITLQRDQYIEITDQYQLTQHVPNITYSLLTPSIVTIPTPDTIVLTPCQLPGSRTSGSATIHFDPKTFTITTESIDTTDPLMAKVWPDHITRITLTAANPPQSATHNIRITR